MLKDCFPIDLLLVLALAKRTSWCFSFRVIVGKRIVPYFHFIIVICSHLMVGFKLNDVLTLKKAEVV